MIMSDSDDSEMETDEFEKENERLIELGFTNLNYATGFRKQNRIFPEGIKYPSPEYVNFYVLSCNLKEYGEINKRKLSNELKEIVGKNKVEEPTHEEMTIARYIEKNAELIRMNEELGALVQTLKAQFNELKPEVDNLVNEERHLRFLYTLLQEKMIFRSQLTHIYNEIVKVYTNREINETTLKEVLLTPYLEGVAFNLTDEELKEIETIEKELGIK